MFLVVESDMELILGAFPTADFLTHDALDAGRMSLGSQSAAAFGAPLQSVELPT